MAGDFEYPKRPKFFAHKFCRVLWKACAANEVGPDVCWMLAGIAMTEDARGYRSPVSYFNGQLCNVAGYGSIQAMIRGRAKAVKAGWLAYKVGGKGFAAKYFVTIPPEHRDWDDSPTDEGKGNTVTISEGKRRGNGEETESIRNQSDVESDTNPESIRNANDKHSSLSLTPIPIPNSSSDATASNESKPKTKSKQAREKKSRKPWPLYDAIAEVTGCNGSHVAKVAKEFEAEENPLTPDEIREFGRRFPELCPHALIDGIPRLPNVGELGKYASRVRSAPPSALVPFSKQPPKTFRQTDRDEAFALLDAMTDKTAAIAEGDADAA